MPAYRTSRRARRLARLASIIEAMIAVAEIKRYMERIHSPRSKHRSTHVRRQRRPMYVKPTLVDKTFRGRFRMEYDDMDLVNMSRGDLQRDDKMGALRNGAVPVEYQAAWEGGEIMKDPFFSQVQPQEQDDTRYQPSAELAPNESAAPVPGEGHGSTASPSPPSYTPAAGPDDVQDKMEGQGAVRTEMPSYSAWKLDQPKVECVPLAGPRQGLKYGALPDDVLTSISNAKKDDCITALTARAEWMEPRRRPAEWKQTPLRITPAKAKKRIRLQQDKNCSKRKKGETIRQSEAYACRLAALTVHPHFWEIYMTSRNRPSRAETDAKEIGPSHAFYEAVARAMIDPEWRDLDGNTLSIPDDHSQDPRAPDRLRSALASLDLEGAALSLQEDQQKWDSEGDFLDSLRERCVKWLKEIRSAHENFQVCAHREEVSGGVGAEAKSDEEAAGATHAFKFMDGKLAAMIWEDGLRKFGGDDEGGNARGGDVMIPDSSEMPGSSVPGGPGALSAAERHRDAMVRDTQGHLLYGSRDTTTSPGGEHFSLSGEELGAISQDDDHLTHRDEQLRASSSVDVSLSLSDEELSQSSLADDNISRSNDKATIMSPPNAKDRGANVEAVNAAVDKLSPESGTGSAAACKPPPASTSGKAPARKPSAASGSRNRRKTKETTDDELVVSCKSALGKLGGMAGAEISRAIEDNYHERDERHRGRLETLLSDAERLEQKIGARAVDTLKTRYVPFLNLVLNKVDDTFEEIDRADSLKAEEAQRAAAAPATTRGRRATPAARVEGRDAMVGAVSPGQSAVATAAPGIGGGATGRTTRPVVARKKRRSAAGGAVSSTPATAATAADGNGGGAASRPVSPGLRRKRIGAARGAVSSMLAAAAFGDGAGSASRAEALDVTRNGRTAVVRAVSTTSASSAAAAGTVGAAAARAATPLIRSKERDAVAGLGSTTPETTSARHAGGGPARLSRPASTRKGRVGIAGAVATSSASGAGDRAIARTARPAVHAEGRGAVGGAALSIPGVGRTVDAGTARRGAVIRTVSRMSAASGSGGGGGGFATDSRPMVRKKARGAVVSGLSSRPVAAAGGGRGDPRTAATPAVAGERAGPVDHVEPLRRTAALAAIGGSAGAGRAAKPAVGGRKGSARVAAAGPMPVIADAIGTLSFSSETSPLVISGRKRAAGGPVVSSPKPAAALLSSGDGLGGHANLTAAVEGRGRTGRGASYKQGTGSWYASERGARDAPPDRGGHASGAPSMGAFSLSPQTVHALAYATTGGVAIHNTGTVMLGSDHRAWSASTTSSADRGGITLHVSNVAAEAEGRVNPDRGGHASGAPSMGAFPLSPQTVHALAYATTGGVAIHNTGTVMLGSDHRAWSAPTTSSADRGGITVRVNDVAAEAEGRRGSRGTSEGIASGLRDGVSQEGSGGTRSASGGATSSSA